MRLAEPQVMLRDDDGELSVLDTFSEVAGARLPLVTFEVAGRGHAPGHEVISASEVRLTEEGAAIFNEVYPAGELFEPFTITWPTGLSGRPASGEGQ